MNFILFSKKFKVHDPVALIECYCFQNDFYVPYDLPLVKGGTREIEMVSKIGARIQLDQLRKCKKVIDGAKNVGIFQYDLDKFLDLDNEAISNLVREVSDNVIKKLIGDGIGLPKATKVLHTIYPYIIPMIDSMLREEYRKINHRWQPNDPYQILMDYYKNLKKDPNRQNLNEVFSTVSENLPGLTKVRVFDILWWSYLKAKTLKEKKGREGINIDWFAIEWR